MKKQGLSQRLVMAFGLTDALVTFMRLMNKVFWPFIGSFVVVYLDDILIYCKTSEEHLIHVKQALETLQANKLQLNINFWAFQSSTFVLGVYVWR